MNPQHQEAQDAAQTMTDAIKLPESGWTPTVWQPIQADHTEALRLCREALEKSVNVMKTAACSTADTWMHGELIAAIAVADKLLGDAS